MRRRGTGWAAAALALLVLGAPASGPPAAAEDAGLGALRERVLAYWQARVRKDYRAEYELLEPRARARLSAEEYGRGRAVEYLAVQVEGVERRGNFARVEVRLLVKVTVPLPQRVEALTQSVVLQDYWVQVGGTWYRTAEADAGAPPPWPAVAP